jgi:hypothetical protein
MSYALEIADEAADDLLALIESLPSSQRADAIEFIDAELQRLASEPLPKAREYFGRPAHEFTFRASGVTHRWGATYRISEDETSLVITHVYKMPPFRL